MSKKYHISKDGVARECRAASQESCRATASDSKEHFNSKEDAQKSYEKSMIDKVSPAPVTKNTKTSEKPSIKSPKSEPSLKDSDTAEPKSKKTPQQIFDEGISRAEKSNKDAIPLDPDLAAIRDLSRKQTRIIIESSKDTILLNDSLMGELTTYPNTDRDYEIQINNLQKHIKNMDSIAKTMKGSKLFNSKEINEVQSRSYMRKFYLARLSLNRFYEDKENKPKSHRVFHSVKKKAAIDAHNTELDKRQNEAFQNFHTQINDVPDSYNREKLETALKEFFPSYAKIIKLT